MSETSVVPQRVKRAIVTTLAALCDLTHRTRIDRLDPTGRVLGCQLASLSDRLDQRWGTGVWKEPT